MKPSLLLLVAFFGAVSGQWLNHRPHYFGSGVQDSAETVVQKFLARMTRSIESKDTSIINGLFQPGFIFKGCKGIYNKQQIVALLSKIPVGTKFTFTLKSAQDTESSIKYTVSATGFGASSIEADFILNKVDQQLESGVIPACQKSHFLGRVGRFGAQDSILVVVEKFLARMTRSIESRDESIISGLFQPEFIFKDCKEIMSKQRLVSILVQRPPKIETAFFLKFAQDNGASIKFTVTAMGFGNPELEADFYLNKADQQLESGIVPVCPKSHFRGFVGGFGVQDSADTVVQKFLARMTRSIESKDTSIINGLFQPGFIFKGCKGTYNKQQIVALLSKIPAGTHFVFTLKSVQDTGVSIKYTVSATGFGPSAIEADFILNKVDQQLESGVVPACQKSHFLDFNDDNILIGRSIVQPKQDLEAIEFARKFLKTMKPILDSRDASEIGKLFDANFFFRGCQGTYTKAQAVAKIVSIPAQASLDFELVSATWKNNMEIEYVVAVSVPGMDKIEVKFVYCPMSGVLKSGRIPMCPKQNFY